MKRTATRAFVLLLLLGLVWSNAQAQVGPAEDHFKVYDASPGITVPGPVVLTDQFGTLTFDTLDLTNFATPVQKNGEPTYDLRRHQTWYRISQLMPTRQVILENQFGAQTWYVKDAAFLVTPALKNETGELPVANHYECYKALGPSLDVPVQLLDQFGNRSAVLLEPVLFCNPVEKQVAGVVYPIVDPHAHLACYRMDPQLQYDIPIVAQDQFGVWQLHLTTDEWLCVPSLKTYVTPAEQSTWGKIKARYSN